MFVCLFVCLLPFFSAISKPIGKPFGTKGIKALKRYVAEDNLLAVKEHLNNLKDSFKIFEERYLEHLSELVSARRKKKDIEASELVFDDMLETYTEVMSKTQGYLKRSEVTTSAPS